MVRDLLQLNTFHKKAIVALFFTCCLLGGAYLTLMKETVAHTMARQAVERSLTETAGEVALLEAEYMQVMDSLTLARAHDLGFVEADVALFVSRRTHTLSFRSDSD